MARTRKKRVKTRRKRPTLTTQDIMRRGHDPLPQIVYQPYEPVRERAEEVSHEQ